MGNTQKLNLNKPERVDHVLISALNANMDTLDSAVMDTRKINGHPLSSDVTITQSDIGVVAVTNVEIDDIVQS